MNISNQSNVTYNAVAPNKPGVPGSLTSNNVNTEILSDSISKVLSSDKTTVKEGETVHNTVTFTNNSAIKLVSILFQIRHPTAQPMLKEASK